MDSQGPRERYETCVCAYAVIIIAHDSDNAMIEHVRSNIATESRYTAGEGRNTVDISASGNDYTWCNTHSMHIITARHKM